MIYVTLALLAVFAATTVTLLQAIRALYRQHARERALLVDQILHLTGKPWHEAPADQVEPVEREPRRWTATPEQNPIFE